MLVDVTGRCSFDPGQVTIIFAHFFDFSAFLLLFLPGVTMNICVLSRLRTGGGSKGVNYASQLFFVSNRRLSFHRFANDQFLHNRASPSISHKGTLPCKHFTKCCSGFMSEDAMHLSSGLQPGGKLRITTKMRTKNSTLTQTAICTVPQRLKGMALLDTDTHAHGPRTSSAGVSFGHHDDNNSAGMRILPF